MARNRTRKPKNRVHTVRSSFLNLFELPKIENIRYTVGFSNSYINTMRTPVTVVDRLGMRMVINPVSGFREEIHRNNEIIDRKYYDNTKGVNQHVNQGYGSLYIIRQYNPGEEGIFQLGQYLHFLSESNNIKSWLEQDDGSRIPVFDIREMQAITKIVIDYIQEQDPNKKPKHVAEHRAVYHPHLGNMLTVAEYERIAKNSGQWEVGTRPNVINSSYLKIPIAFSIDYDDFVAGDMSVYDERMDLLFSLLDMKKAPHHPYDVNLNKPNSIGTYTPGTVTYDRMNELVGDEMVKRSYNKSYRYVVDIDAYNGSPPSLFVPIHKDKVMRLCPVRPDERYIEEGVYITYRYWDDVSREEVVESILVPLHDEATLNEYQVFDNISAARSTNEHKTKVQYDEALEAMRSKIRKEELVAKAKAEEAEVKRVETEIKQRETEHKIIREKQKGFWDGLKSIFTVALPHLLTAGITLLGVWLKSKFS